MTLPSAPAGHLIEAAPSAHAGDRAVGTAPGLPGAGS